MKIWTLLTLTALGISLSASEIILSQKQITDLGIITAPVSKTKTFLESNFAATVVIPQSQISLASSMQEGVIQKVYVSVGDTVKVGEKLATVASMQGVVLQREYLQSGSLYKQTAMIEKKNEALFHEGIISEMELLKSKQELLQASTNLQEKKEMMRLLGITASAKGTFNAPSVITSPINGVILEQMANIGQKIDAMSPLYKIADLSRLWLEVQVPSSVAKTIKIGDQIKTDLGAVAKVIKISNAIEAQNQSVIVRAEIISGVNLVRAGEFTKAVIVTKDAEHLVVPKSAIVRNGDETVVFVQTPKGFSPLHVSILKEESADFIIDASLANDAKVATHGIIALKGMLLGGEQGE